MDSYVPIIVAPCIHNFFYLRYQSLRVSLCCNTTEANSDLTFISWCIHVDIIGRTKKTLKCHKNKNPGDFLFLNILLIRQFEIIKKSYR
jgi:hypothetical protein